MTLARSLKWIAAVLIIPLALAVMTISLFGWNWLRAPIERITLQQTGRQLTIAGDLELRFAWPQPRLHAAAVSFANPAWAKEKQMVIADAVELSIDLWQLLRLNVVFPEVRLTRPVVFLERGNDGRRNWLLDSEQHDEAARIRIDRLILDRGTLGYDDAVHKTRLRAELSSASARAGTDPAGEGVTFSAQGVYLGLPLKASGQGGPVLALRDESTPYPLRIDLRVGPTVIKAEGSVTSLLKFAALDMRLALSGQSLAQLFPLLGMAFPETRAYALQGHLVHLEKTWRYEDFSGRIGASDIAGSLQVDTGGKRPQLKAKLLSRLLDLDDLGPLIGAQPGSVDTARQAAPSAAEARVLPEMPFKTERWDSVDAEVSLEAKTIRRAKTLPLADLFTHLSLRDSVLTLDPLDFGIAGGHLNGSVVLDGRVNPIAARVKLRARKIRLAELFPTSELGSASIGQINGEFALAGYGNTVRHMLATADGKIGLVVSRGQISRLMMERAGLHLWEVLELNLTGDKLVKLRCAVADFDVKAGLMRSDALVFDTEVTTILGTGNIDLAQEKLDLTLSQKTKNTSPLALRSPLHLGGSFAHPDFGVDKGPLAMRAFGAVALAMINPLLALIPLIDAGPGSDSDCRQLVSAARALPRVQKNRSSDSKLKRGS